MKQSVFFAEGLTQEEESDKLKGGYDVSINSILPNGQEGRLMFLQYKSGFKISYSNKSISKFYRKTAKAESRSPEHIMFTINDAAEKTQHSTLRNLANKPNIEPKSVMYVFPRITEKRDFKNKLGNLIFNSSFVPVLEIDKQASEQKPSVNIIDGVKHNYRTSYDGLTSEVNYFYFFFYYDSKIISELLSELICIQIERLTKLLLKQPKQIFEFYLKALSESIDSFVEKEFILYPSKDILLKKIKSYLDKIFNDYSTKAIIPNAPSEFTTIIPKEGIVIKIKNISEEFDKNNEIELEFSKLNYQIF